MVWASTMGLPRSLEGVGTVLGLEKQKLTEGKDLIKYFCVPCTPTKSNGGRTRNLPRDALDRWEAFKRYNIRDVETEMGIKECLSKFPVPDFVWDEYHIDQEINDRGIRRFAAFDEYPRLIEMARAAILARGGSFERSTAGAGFALRGAGGGMAAAPGAMPEGGRADRGQSNDAGLRCSREESVPTGRFASSVAPSPV